MDASEYWILRYVVQQPEPTDALLADDFYEWFNAPFHGLREFDLVELLWSLFRRGDLMVEDQPRYVLTKAQVKASLSQNPVTIAKSAFRYGLTAQGGARWERAAQADWSRYYTSLGSGWGGKETLVHSDPRFPQEYLRRNRAESWGAYKSDYAVWNVLVPWQATYWKQLPRGYQLRWYTEEAPTPLSHQMYVEKLAQIRESSITPQEFWAWRREVYEPQKLEEERTIGPKPPQEKEPYHEWWTSTFDWFTDPFPEEF